MPFSKYDADFSGDLMEAMRAAFYRVCDILQLSGDREDPLTEIVVRKIIELAGAGEHDPEVLCIDVLAEFGAQNDRTMRPTPDPSAATVSAEETVGAT